MNPDPFEEELARVPLRPPPATWREEILASVLPAACRHERQPAARFVAFRSFCSFCRTHFSPGWSAVAAAWLVILGLNRLAASGAAPAAPATPLSPAFLAAVRAQQAELLRLAELDAPPVPPPAPAATEEKPRPRGPRAHWPGVGEGLEARLAALECDAKRSTGSFGAASSCEPGLVVTRPSLIAATFLGA